MDVLMQKLALYGVNTREIMERFVNDTDFYRDCLLAFLQDPCVLALDKAMLSGDYDGAFSAAHTLKGVTGSLGLTPLYDAVCQLVEPLRHQAYNQADTLYDRVLAENRRLAAILKECL